VATVPVMTTVSAGGIGTAALWNGQVRDLGNFFLSGRPKFQGRQTVAQSIPNAANTSITLDVEDHDNDSGHSTSTNTSRYTTVTAGWYWCSGHVCFTNTGTGGDRRALLAVNGSTVNGSQGNETSDASVPYAVLCSPTLIFLNVGDYLEIQGFQSSTAALNTAVSGAQQSALTAIWLST